MLSYYCLDKIAIEFDKHDRLLFCVIDIVYIYMLCKDTEILYNLVLRWRYSVSLAELNATEKRTPDTLS